MKWKGECVCSCITKHKAQQEGPRAADGREARSARQQAAAIETHLTH